MILIEKGSFLHLKVHKKVYFLHLNELVYACLLENLTNYGDCNNLFNTSVLLFVP